MSLSTVAVLALLAVACVAVAAAASFVRHHGPAIVALRFAAGLPLSGHRRTDASPLRRGTRSLHGATGRASAWAHLPYAYRAAVRWGCVVCAGTLAWGALVHPVATLAVLSAVAACLAPWGLLRAFRIVARLRHRHDVEGPLALALSPVLAVTPSVTSAALTVVPEYADTKGGEPVARLGLPDAFHAASDQQKRVEDLFASRLGVDCRFTWRTSRAPMLLEVSRAPVPPDMVPLADVMADVDKCEEGTVVLGKNASGNVFYGDFLNEDPHWGVSAGSRRGKTTLLCVVAAQLLRQGAERVTGIDPKMISLDPLVGLPRVDIRNDPRDVQSMWDAVADFRAHMDGRMNAYSKDRTLEFRRSLLIIDEINQFAAMSLDHWRAIKEKSDPAQPPVWRDLAAIAWQGAQLRCNMIVVGQRLDTAATGGAGLRDSFGIRMLAGFTPQQWGFLVGTYPVPRSQKPRGRFIVVNGGEQTWVQLVLATPQEIRDLASDRLRPAGTSPASTVSRTDGGEGRGTGPTSLPVRYGLREASSDLGAGIVPMRYEALKKARQSDDTFPQGRAIPSGTTYTREELSEWHEAREARKASA